MNYQFVVHRDLTKQQVINLYENYSFPSFEQKSKVRTLQEPFWAIKVLLEEKIVGLAIIEFIEKEKIIKIISLLVLKNHRRHKIAINILSIVEKIAKNNLYKQVVIFFQNNWNSFSFFPSLLENAGWSSPQESMVTVKLSFDQIKDLSWFTLQEYPPNISVHRWIDLSNEDYEYIKQKQEKENWYPEMLSPFQLESIMVHSGCLVLKNEHNLVVGWLIIHRVAARTGQFTAYFIDKEYRKTSATFNLLVDSIQRMRALDEGDDALFMFESSNTTMIHFAKAIAGESNTEAFTHIWVSHKTIS